MIEMPLQYTLRENTQGNSGRTAELQQSEAQLPAAPDNEW